MTKKNSNAKTEVLLADANLIARRPPHRKAARDAYPRRVEDIPKYVRLMYGINATVDTRVQTARSMADWWARKALDIDTRSDTRASQVHTGGDPRADSIQDARIRCVIHAVLRENRRLPQPDAKKLERLLRDPSIGRRGAEVRTLIPDFDNAYERMFQVPSDIRGGLRGRGREPLFAAFLFCATDPDTKAHGVPLDITAAVLLAVYFKLTEPKWEEGLEEAALDIDSLRRRASQTLNRNRELFRLVLKPPDDP